MELEFDEMSKIEQNYLILDKEEVRALYRIIEREWINRDDLAAMAVANKISKYVQRNEC